MNSNPNPLWWDCEKSGCFNKCKRPPIELFNPCFKRGVNFGDVDAEVEAGKGRLLKIEWKKGRNIPAGQITSFVNQTRVNFITIIQVDGIVDNPSTPNVRGFRVFEAGEAKPWIPGDFEALKRLVEAWYCWADNSPALPLRVEPKFENNSPLHAKFRSNFDKLTHP